MCRVQLILLWSQIVRFNINVSLTSFEFYDDNRKTTIIQYKPATNYDVTRLTPYITSINCKHYQETEQNFALRKQITTH